MLEHNALDPCSLHQQMLVEYTLLYLKPKVWMCSSTTKSCVFETRLWYFSHEMTCLGLLQSPSLVKSYFCFEVFEGLFKSWF